MNRIQIKDHRIGTYEIDKISLSCFDDKIYIQNNGYDGLALGYQSLLEKTVILIILSDCNGTRTWHDKNIQS